MAPAPLGPEHVNEGAASTGHTVAFCVRLCDGQHFPLEQMAGVTPVETCHAICPSSQTKVFFGAEIDAAQPRATARIIPISRPRFFIASSWSPIAPATARTLSVLHRWTRRPIPPYGPATSFRPRRASRLTAAKEPASRRRSAPVTSRERSVPAIEFRRGNAAKPAARRQSGAPITAMQNVPISSVAARTRNCPA